MTLSSEFVALPLENLHHEAAVLKTEGWRFIQTHAVNTDNGIDLYYSFMKDGKALNYRVESVSPESPVPSITDLFLAAFVFENEARELFGVNMQDIAIDFKGAMYAPAEQVPMTFMSPEQKAARDKARAAAAKKDAAPKAAEGEKPAVTAGSGGGFVMTPERRARLDAKLATMSPDKVAKVEAALKAREAEAKEAPAPSAAPSAASSDSAESPSTSKPAAATEPFAPRESDEQLESLIKLMDEAKAETVRAALSMKGGE